MSEYKLCEYRRYGTTGQWYPIERDKTIGELQAELYRQIIDRQNWEMRALKAERELSLYRVASSYPRVEE